MPNDGYSNSASREAELSKNGWTQKNWDEFYEKLKNSGGQKLADEWAYSQDRPGGFKGVGQSPLARGMGDGYGAPIDMQTGAPKRDVQAADSYAWQRARGVDSALNTWMQQNPTFNAANADAVRAQQTDLIQMLQGMAQGNGPSAAQAMLNRGADQNMAQALSMAANQQGRQGGQAAMRQAQLQRMQIGQGLSSDAAQLRAQEQMGAVGMLGNAIGQTRGMDLQSELSRLAQENTNRGNQLSGLGMQAQLAEGDRNANIDYQKLLTGIAQSNVGNDLAAYNAYTGRQGMQNQRQQIGNQFELGKGQLTMDQNKLNLMEKEIEMKFGADVAKSVASFIGSLIGGAAGMG